MQMWQGTRISSPPSQLCRLSSLLRQSLGLRAGAGVPFSSMLQCYGRRGSQRRRKLVIKASSDHTGVSVPRFRPTFPAQAKASSKEADLLAVVVEAEAAAAAAVQAVSSFWLLGLGFHTVSSC